MGKKYKVDKWNIIEEGFNPEFQRASESIFSIGNGRIGQRGNFEEDYSEDHLLGSYAAGIYYKDPTKVGWWKVGYPDYYSRIPNAPNWSKVKVRLIDEELNLAEWDVKDFTRILHMKDGMQERTFTATSPKGNTISVKIEHFLSMKKQDLCLIKYSVKSENYTGKLSLLPYIEGDVFHEEANYQKKMWNIIEAKTTTHFAYLRAQVQRETSQVCIAFTHRLFKNEKEFISSSIRIEKEKSVGYSAGMEIKPGDTLTLYKYTAITSSLYYEIDDLVKQATRECNEAAEKGWASIYQEHADVWNEIWNNTDVIIEDDAKAQQAIRFNIFQLNQSYRGDDPRLNIGPKGFTGEKYGGNTQWNTELCCVPFFLVSMPNDITQNLLLYRFRQLPKAIENAEKLGYHGGAALFPMATLDGKESHNEWEITFEEIHRNNIIVFAIDQYVQYSGKIDIVAKYGLEIMIAICRFWVQRVTLCSLHNQYALLGVTGPNEYEVNVNNNWYTNFGCKMCLLTSIDYVEKIEKSYPEDFQRISLKTSFCAEEKNKWKEIAEKLYLPEDKEKGIFLQQEGFLDKVLRNVDTLSSDERPLNQHWAWDRILRSCFIKQADVLLGCFLYHNMIDKESIRRNFEFYEPLTLHESSLSPFVHAILAAWLQKTDKAYDLFMRAVRMDLDDYNNEVDKGLHITSMAGSWLILAEGFAGMKIRNFKLHLHPCIPDKWSHYSININFMENTIRLDVYKDRTQITNQKGNDIELEVYDRCYKIEKAKRIDIKME